MTATHQTSVAPGASCRCDSDCSQTALLVAAIEHLREECQAFALRDVQAEQQRISVSRRIHDLLGNRLALIGTLADGLRHLERRVLAVDPQLHTALQALVQQIVVASREVYADARSLACSLMPECVEALGLVSALGDLAQHTTVSHGLQVDIAFEPISLVIPEDVSFALYQLVEDALRAAVEAKAHKSSIALSQPSAAQVRLVIHHEGQSRHAVAPHATMRARIEILNGRISTSFGASATTIDICVPLR